MGYWPISWHLIWSIANQVAIAMGSCRYLATENGFNDII